MILLTGGSGLVGSHILYELLQKGEPVRAIIRSEERKSIIAQVFSYYSDEVENLLSKVDWFEADLMDVDALTMAMEGISKVIHAAAIVSFNKKDKQELYRVNVKGTANLVNICLSKGVEKFAFVSSVAALGSAEPGAETDESAIWNDPADATNYSRSKYMAEMEVWRGSEEGMPVVIVNPATIIGPGEWGRGSTALVLRSKEGLRAYTDGVTGYVDVRDVAKVMVDLLLSERKNERYLLCAANLSYKELFCQFADALGRERPDFRAKPWMLNAAWILDNLRSFITRKQPIITRETARKAFSVVRYNGNSVCQVLGFKYIPIEESILHTAKCLLRSV